MRGATLLLCMATLLLGACAHVDPNAGQPVREEIAKVKVKTAAVAAKVLQKAPEMKDELAALQTNVESVEKGFREFEKKYVVAAERVGVLEATLKKVTSARDFWRGITITAGIVALLGLSVLIIPKIPL